MNLEELKKLDVESLQKELSSLMRARFNARLQLATQQSTNTAQTRSIRRDVARVMTLLRQQGVRA